MAATTFSAPDLEIFHTVLHARILEMNSSGDYDDLEPGQVDTLGQYQEALERLNAAIAI